MKREIVVAFFLFFICEISGQVNPIDSINYNNNIQKDSLNYNSELLFTDFLIEQNEIDLAIFNLILMTREATYKDFIDSLNFIIGKLYLSLNNYSESSEYFSKVKNSNPELYYNSQLFLSFNEIFIGQYNRSRQINDSICFYFNKDKLSLNLNQYGLALLERNLNDANNKKKEFPQNTLLNDQFLKMNLIHNEIMNQKNKSPFVAGVLSAFVPGLGKYYAGRRGEAISAFMINMLLGCIFYENIVKNGITSPQSIIYGSLFSVFYIGNIWGSAMSVNIKWNEQNKIINDEILFNLHIAIKNL